MTHLTADDLLGSIKDTQRNEPDSGIIVAVNRGFGKPGLIPLWTGEGHLPTPDFICKAAAEGLRNGETFYTWQRGIPRLREALSRYHEKHFSRPVPADNFFVTGSGMQAIQTVIQLLAGQGDEIIVPTPAWPNYSGPMRMAGVTPVAAPMRFENGHWRLDLQRIFESVTDRTKAICINSPSNPIGCVVPLEDLQDVLGFARKRGLWIIADEVYSRFYYPDNGQLSRAPSFLDICDLDERVIFANTFSKNWAMTGWRVGWVQAPVALGGALERIIQYNTSGTAAFMQRGCVAALEQGEAFADAQVRQARENRDLVCEALSAFPQLRFEVPKGAFYLFFAVEGLSNSLDAVVRIIDEANVGLAPGGTFGEGGEGFLRMCYLRDPAQLKEAIERLGNWLSDARLT